MFAGVGGFRLGLERSKGNFKVIWSNQWEPSTKRQHASEVYEARFGEKGHTNIDIAEVKTENIPDHDLLVGGFPCQDYSVATSLVNSKGLLGKKGVLWWSIHRILQEKETKPSFLMLENVDRLLKSPSDQRGRDFAVMLKSLDDLGYAVEWRVINAADYGMPQRRKRVFFIAYHKSTNLFKQLKLNVTEWIDSDGVFAKAFPIERLTDIKHIHLHDDIVKVSKNFNTDENLSPFQNTGVMINGTISTSKTEASYIGGKIVLGDILVPDKEVPNEFYVKKADLKKWKYLKGSKKEERITKEGFEYFYSEGSMVFPDSLDNASRTIITGEGGKTPSRFKHVVRTKKGLRRLTPIELEKLNMFPENHTKLEGISDAKRAFFMGNALVVGIVEKLGSALTVASSKKVKNRKREAEFGSSVS